MMTTKSPPSTFGVNVGLCLPRSRVAAVAASSPSTTSVASMTCHDGLMSPAFGVYVGTALLLPFEHSRSGPGRDRVPVRRRQGWFPATDVDPDPLATARQPCSLPAGVCAGQNAHR